MKHVTALTLPERKLIRAKVIARYMHNACWPGAVCFTCGNASEALKKCGVDVLSIGGGESPLTATQWWRPWQIRKTWPHLFDATSGHLPMPLMVDVAKALYREIGYLVPGRYFVPTGSGETVLCLRWMYPKCCFVACYGAEPHVAFNKSAPLNNLVKSTGPCIGQDFTARKK